MVIFAKKKNHQLDLKKVISNFQCWCIIYSINKLVYFLKLNYRVIDILRYFMSTYLLPEGNKVVKKVRSKNVFSRTFLISYQHIYFQIAVCSTRGFVQKQWKLRSILQVCKLCVSKKMVNKNIFFVHLPLEKLFSMCIYIEIILLFRT